MRVEHESDRYACRFEWMSELGYEAENRVETKVTTESRN